MPLAQPKILFALNASSGSTIQNSGTAGNAVVQAGSTENTHWQWVPGATALLSYLELLFKDTSGASQQPYIDLTSYTLGTTYTYMYYAVGFRLASLDTTILNEGYLAQATGGRGGLKMRVTPNGGGFDLFCHFESSGFAVPGEHSYTGLSFGTDYRVVAYCDPIDTANVICKFLLDSGSVITTSPVNTGSETWNTDVGYIDRRHDFDIYGGVAARLYYWVHDRGVALSDADMAAINTDPATAWTGWPSSSTNATGSPTNALATAGLGTLQPLARPAPPYTNMAITG